MSGFLIKECYLNTYLDQIHGITSLEDIQIKTNNYFEVKQFSFGTAVVKMIYHIELRKFFVIKIFMDFEDQKLLKREYENVLNVHHPLLLKCYGITKINSKNALILQYFNGIALTNIKNNHITSAVKLDITIQIIIVLKYLHENHYIYRDLKPDNILFGESQTIALIDLDRMIKIDQKKPDDQTGLSSQYVSPEIANGLDFSYASDIYSFGMVLYFLMFEETPNTTLIEKKCAQFSRSTIDFSLCDMICECVNKDPNKRPSINELASFFLDFYQVKLNHFTDADFIQNTFCKYECYASYLNDPKAYLLLGCDYLEGIHIGKNIDKAIYYIKQAANQNDPHAQFMLGLSYYNGDILSQNIKKSIHFLTLAAEKNHSEALFKLGSIFYEGKYVRSDINKSIHYFMLAAKNNHREAQFNIGYLYHEGKYLKQNINKTIYYYKLAADQNMLQAQLNLGFIYLSDAIYNINKASL